MCVRDRSVHVLALHISNHSVDSICSMHQCLINAKTVEADAKFKKTFWCSVLEYYVFFIIVSPFRIFVPYNIENKTVSEMIKRGHF